MARKKMLKLYKENELQDSVTLNITENGEQIIILENDKVAIKNVSVNVNVVQEIPATLMVQCATGSYGYKGNTYLSLHQPISETDYMLSSASGNALTECNAVAFNGVSTVYIWGNGYAKGEYTSDMFVSLASNKTYDTAVEVTVNDGDVLYLESYYAESEFHT